jgi:flagellar biosynthesis/type III secretory pathway chaperone
VTTSCQNVVDRLRAELEEYGALLRLFGEQQANLLRRDPDAVLALAASIEDQARITQNCREAREHALRDFAAEHAQPAGSSLRNLLPFFSAELQPLIDALMTEMNHLIHRIRRGARQNQVLLSRTVEAHEEALRTLRPDLFPKTYSPRGSVASTATAHAWQAAG